MLLLKLLLQILTVGTLFLTSILDYVAYDKRTRKFKYFKNALFIVAGVSLIFSLIVTILDDLDRKKEISELKHELNRGLHIIEDVGLEFLVSSEINHLAQFSVESYLTRILPIVDSINASQFPVENGNSVLTIPFFSKSPLFPELKTERTAYTFFSHICIGLEIFIDSVKAETFINSAGHTQGVGDLVYMLSRSAGQTENNDVFLSFDLNRKKQIFISGANVKAGVSKKNTGKIVSILDLAGATGVLYFCPKSYQSEEEKKEFQSIGNNFHLDIFGLNLSGGRKIFLNPIEHINSYGERVYVLKFPETIEEIENLIQE